MSDLFDTLFDMHLLNEVASDNFCDICNTSAKYYVVCYYIHVCSKKCFDKFVQRVDEEIHSLAIEQLKGVRLNGSD